jgi:hypothetical protein
MKYRAYMKERNRKTRTIEGRREQYSGGEEGPLLTTASMLMGSHVKGHETKFRA